MSLAPVHSALQCRPSCGACCIAPSISSPIPGMPQGKPAGVRCVQLDQENRCKIFQDPARPTVCSSLQPAFDMCGDNREHAMLWLTRLEQQTAN
ncbi:MAG: YkgJ family cysteine cluster protein [Burkholderiales bacterium]|nr:YkgJ family cysteine cluster protein [Burkholderiales bacterium]